MADVVTLRTWVENEFNAATGAYLRSAIPRALQLAQRKSAKAHLAFDDEDGELYVYGVAMSRADHKMIKAALKALDSFSTERPKGSKRELLLVDGKIIFPIRVGTKMPRKISEIRLRRISPYRRGVFRRTSMRKYESVLPGFEDDADEVETEVTEQEEGFLHAAASKNSLIVVFYSSTPNGLGSAYWAPAAMTKANYLSFVDPKRLEIVVENEGVADSQSASEDDSFAAGERPRTRTKLRKPTSEPGEN
jgi:hypothetical protein